MNDHHRDASATSATEELNPASASCSEKTEPLATDPPLRPFFVLWGGQTLSLVGSNAVQFALIWWLTAETGSATVLAMATLFGLAPQVALGPLIGALIDRWNRKLVMLLADGLIAVASLVLAGLYISGVARTEHVLALLFLRTLGGAFHAPAMMASTTLMVPERLFTQIQGLNQSAQGLQLIISAPLGALLFALLPMGKVMFVDVGTALIAIVPLLFIHVPQPKAKPGTVENKTVWQEMIDGFQYLRRRSGYLTMICLAAGINMLLVPAFSLLPLLVLDRLQGDAAQLGWITSVFGVGMLMGGGLLALWGGFSRRILTTLSAMIAMGLAVVALGVTPAGTFWWALGSMFAIGFIVPLVNGPLHAIIQATIPPDFQGRVFTLIGSLAGAAAPIGLLVAAPVAEIVGVGAWYLAGGVMCVLMGISGFFSPALMRIEEKDGTTA